MRLNHSSGSLFFPVLLLGSRFRENFRHILSAKDTPEIGISRAKLVCESRAPDKALQKNRDPGGALDGGRVPRSSMVM